MRKQKRFLSSMAVFVIPLFLASCMGMNDPYKANMKTRSEQTLYKETMRQKAVESVTGAVKMIIGALEDEAVKERVAQASANDRFVNKIGTVKGTDSNFAMAVMGDVMMFMIKEHAKGEVARARAEAVRYLEPIIAQLYKEEADRLGVPPTSAQVAMKFFEQIPFVVTVAGMYSLGKAGIEAAGSNITNTLNGNGDLNQTNTRIKSPSSDGSTTSNKTNNGTGNQDSDNPNSNNPVYNFPEGTTESTL